ncbi:MAG: hypothetical protein J6S67_08475 [Methanobrevibacter sp.]|nr:hypothetical protein [Methanobrevibacter sp.]
MEKAKFFIEEGIRKFYDENNTLLKEEKFSRFYKCTYEDKKENEKNESKEILPRI